MSLFPERERLRLQKLNLEDELLSLHEREKALRERVSALENLESIRNEKLESTPPTLPKVSLEWSASPEKVRSLYAT